MAEEEGKFNLMLMECSICNEIIHPGCLKVRGGAVVGPGGWRRGRRGLVAAPPLWRIFGSSGSTPAREEEEPPAPIGLIHPRQPMSVLQGPNSFTNRSPPACLPVLPGDGPSVTGRLCVSLAARCGNRTGW